MDERTIPNFGSFTEQILGGFLPAETVYILKRLFEGRMIEYMFYPKADGTSHTASDYLKVADRFALFEVRFATSIQAGIEFVRELCEDYSEPLDDWSDSEICAAIRPQNMKWIETGPYAYESYCDFGLVHPHLDLVLRFDQQMDPISAHFDG